MIKTLGIDHVSLVVHDIRLSEPFYTKVLCFLGFEKVLDNYGIVDYRSDNASIILLDADVSHRTDQFDRLRLGINHLALRVDEKGEVDRFFEFLIKKNIRVDTPPKELKQFRQDYYFFKFLDPDGLVIEIMSFL